MTVTPHNASVMKPVARTVQPKPILAKRRWYMIGQTTPPSPEPDAATPMARLRFLRKNVDTAESEG